MDYNKIHFVSSIQNLYYLPPNNIKEIAFIGRSNSGKSSVINSLSNQKKLARTSKKQGSTKLINTFEIPLTIRLMDFPGYGYSHSSKKNRKKWEKILYQYIKERKNLIGIILITDIRNPINQLDQNIIQKTDKTKIPLLILLNKSDKLKKNISHIKIKNIKKLFFHIQKIQIIKFSTKTSEGIYNLQNIINIWYLQNKKKQQNHHIF